MTAIRTVLVAGLASVATCLLTAASTLAADAPPAATQPATKPAPRAARSVHLWWPAPPATDFYNELTVAESTRGTYFMACGFSHGYFGMQELNGKPQGLAGDRGKSDKVVIFSIWDTHKGDDPKAVPVDTRVEVLYHADDVRIGRFGGEGTGAQSFFTYAWKPGETCRFLVRSRPDGEKTAFSAYFYLSETKQWKHLATFQTITKGANLTGLYSFVEDFRRDGKSVTETRRAQFGNGWTRSAEGGGWVSLSKARFTADATPLDNVDAGFKDDRFFLATGGDVANLTKLKSTINRPDAPAPTTKPAIDVALPE